MIFLVSRASIGIPDEETDYEDSLEELYKYHSKKPCEGAFKVTIKHVYNPDCGDNLEVQRWAIEINSLEELLEFRKKNNQSDSFYNGIDIQELTEKDNVQGTWLRILIHDDYTN